MGVSASVNTQKNINNMVQSDYNSCGNGSSGAYNVVSLNGIQFDPPSTCPPNNSLQIGQTATVNATCLISALQSTAAQLASQLNATQQASLGFSFGYTNNVSTTDISNFISNQCQSYSSANIASINDTVIESCNFQIVQDATVNQSCQINATQDLINNISNLLTSQTSGGSVFGDLFGNGPLGAIVGIIIVIVIIVVIAVIGIIVFKAFFSGSSKQNQQKLTEAALLAGGGNGYQIGSLRSFLKKLTNSTTFGNEIKKNKAFTILIILFLLILATVFLIASCKIKQPLTEADLEKFGQTVSEANKIAGLVQIPTEEINTNTDKTVKNYAHSDYSDYSDYLGEANEDSLSDFYKPLL